MNMLCSVFRAIVWFVLSPRNWLHVGDGRWWRVARSLHRSVRVSLMSPPQVGRDVRVGRRTTVRVHAGGQLVLEDGAWVGDDCEIGVLGTVRVGQGTSLQHRTQVHGDVYIGAGCVCAANLYLASTTHRFKDIPPLPIRWQDAADAALDRTDSSRPVVVEDDCWLGINVVVCPGVTLGRGTVVGANAVVTTSMPPYSVVAGVPARVVGQRLAFEPPVEVVADSVEHIPYFYAGFEVPNSSQSWRSVTERGRWVQHRFALALKANVAHALRLDVVAVQAARLKHGGIAYTVPQGVSTVVVDALPDARGLLWFSVEDWQPHVVAVLAARLEGSSLSC